jgi:hypothetical protein
MNMDPGLFPHRFTVSKSTRDLPGWIELPLHHDQIPCVFNTVSRHFVIVAAAFPPTEVAGKSRLRELLSSGSVGKIKLSFGVPFVFQDLVFKDLRTPLNHAWPLRLIINRVGETIYFEILL